MIGGESIGFRVRVEGGKERAAVRSAWASYREEWNGSWGEGDEGEEREGLGWVRGEREWQSERAGQWRGGKGAMQIGGGSLGFRVRVAGGKEGAVMGRVGRVWGVKERELRRGGRR